MRTTWPLRIMTAFVVLATVLATAAKIGQGSGPIGTSLLYIVVVSAYLAVGPIIIERLPGHAVGPILLVFGGSWPSTSWPMRISPDARRPEGGGPCLGVSQIDGPMFALVALALPVLSRPGDHRRRDGASSSGSTSWRPPASPRFGVQAGTIRLLRQHLQPVRDPRLPGDRLWEPAYLLLIGSVGLSALSLIGRWRRGGRSSGPS